MIATLVAALVPGTDVTEIHLADSPANFSLANPQLAYDDQPTSGGKDHRSANASDEFPTRWSTDDHDGWRIPIPGESDAAPCLWGDYLFLLSADSGSRRVSMLCNNRSDGHIAWRTQLHVAAVHETAGQPSRVFITPVCDGRNVYSVTCFNGQLWVTAVNFDGKIVWQHAAGPHDFIAQYRSSPILFKSLVIVAADRAAGSYLAALHRQTGEIIWRVKRPAGESFGTPAIATIAGRAQLVLGGRKSVHSYDPATGECIWLCRTSAERCSNCVAFDTEHVYASCPGLNAGLVCIKADGRGDITASHLLWQIPGITGEFPSPVYHDKSLYVLADDGRLSCVRTDVGKVEWTRQLAGHFIASPVIAGKFLLCASRSGKVCFVQTGIPGLPAIENMLAGGIDVAPIVAGDSIYIRTSRYLHRIDPTFPEPVAERTEPEHRRF